MTPLEQVYDRVSKKLGLSRYVVEDCFKSQFELVEQTMANALKGEHESVRLDYFGVFWVNDRLRKKQEELFKKDNNGECKEGV